MQNSFWTPELLSELIILFPKLPPKKLERRFHKQFDKLQQVYEFQTQHQRLHLKTTVENGIKITYYKPYDAHKILEKIYLPPIEYDDESPEL